ncbi:TetR family transcriptional regulator [Streptomyces sp. SID14478]|uniref:TetR/AcrR family transcriptional regulator C-terminal domain-containing protein n=1 Tax=Streptomyces sp. SID14478 TaxID=2706073 RepID=UPI0013DA9F6C|nr:TetR/AcrR family transcriptional regulator C-terminal domain-containing protein [Streptomyces sp. SID14478]NEB75552.1 TetR family transcriptional regulator [Streptomyces sp. SID14478]
MNREAVVDEALDLLDEVGLDAVSTRQLARRLGVEQPSLYYHFKNKKELLGAMARAAMAPHVAVAAPEPGDDWRDWFFKDTRSFRRTLLMRRDGARLHAGSSPEPADLERIGRKLDFLIAAGIPEHHAQMAVLAAGRYTVGCALEEQADVGLGDIAGRPGVPLLAHEAAFEAGLDLIVGGLERRITQ